MMDQKVIILDTLYGFAIYMTEQGIKNNPNIRNRGKIVCDKNNKPLMFTNANIAILNAEVTLELEKGDFKLKVIKYDHGKNKITNLCNFEAMQPYRSNAYQMITKDDVLYYIKEQKIESVSSIRYFVFENGDTERTSVNYGRKRNRELIKLIISAAVDYFYKSGELSGVRRVNADEVEIRFKNSSAIVHIMTNGLIANINKQRKELGESSRYQRCIPYDSQLDKFVTLFSYVSKELAEPEYAGYNDDIDGDIENLYQHMEEYFAAKVETDDRLEGFKYRKIEFNGVILVKE